jgi:pimeloyl-ACP methyl ester carboxylesterase
MTTPKPLITGDPDNPRDPHATGLAHEGADLEYCAKCSSGDIRVIVCTHVLDGTDPDEWRNNRLKGLETFGTVAAAAPVILTSLAGPNAQHVVPEACEAMARIPMAGMLTSLSILPSHDSRAILPEITVPTLVLIGEDDDETPPSYSKAIVDLMPNATLVTIPGAGHLLNLEAPDAVNRAILQHWETT